ncbi:phytanoyl-CoA dioxygenase family protein [Tateyamaria sp.]|uniref:phytanoyl-CoA dioxygenase family protein n=1 Tax=Tateyamaria sp. TaxID=1929288 RepID=UPI003B21784A
MKDQSEAFGGYYAADDCEIGDFHVLIRQSADAAAMPQADELRNNIPIYDMARLRPALDAPDTRQSLMAEWANVFLNGPGVLALRGVYADTRPLDAATTLFEKIITEEKMASGGSGDHFAASGANDRIWNACQKLCLCAPEVFLQYFGNAAIDAVAEAWLGPNYQMTAQVNLVHPGGAAQQAHRDYHLGFQTAQVSGRYPAHVHDLSASLTLQGAIAHCDMPVESGPTKLLPVTTQLPDLQCDCATI